MMLAEKRTKLSKKVNVREIRRLTKSGHQTAIITTDFVPDMTVIAGTMFARWSQENFFKYMREHFGIDKLIEYGTTPVDETEKNIQMGELPECEKYSSLTNEKKHIMDTIKMIAYRAETAMASMVQPKLSQRKATKVLLRQIFSTEVDLEPDTKNNILNVSLHSLSNEKSNKIAINLCKQLNETETVFPGTEMRLSYKLVSM